MAALMRLLLEWGRRMEETMGVVRAILGLIVAAGLGAAPPVVLVHGGAGSSRERQLDGTESAARRGREVLRAGGGALEAALEATVVLEDDPRFNAGTGANIRLDGRTVQMDAAVMEGLTGDFGAVAALEQVKNPVRVALKVMESPHLLLAGEGAQRFARAMGFPPYDPICAESRARFERLKGLLAKAERGNSEMEAWTRYDWRKAWNFPRPLKEALEELLGHPDTVGAVARDAQGRYAAAISTGGTSITFYGRVGDVPILGAGIYAGPKGAVACTGHGEEIVKRFVAKAVYDDLARGLHPQAAVDRALRGVPPGVGLGIIAVGDRGDGAGCNLDPARRGTFRGSQRMAWSLAR